MVRVLGSAVTVGLAALWCGTTSAAAAPQPPKLIVAISVDQLSAGLFDQYRGRFTGGLKRMLDGGVVFPNGYQSHAATETCPGHSTLLTGRHPSATGIVANEWLDAEGKKVYCVYDASVSVPGRAGKPRGPANLRVSTLGEWLKKQNPESRTVAVSGKDRSAITMAGHNPDAVYWWDDELGFNTYVSKDAGEARVPAPVQTFNDEITRRWNKARPAWKRLDKTCSALNGEGTYDGQRIVHQVPPLWQPADATKPFRDDASFKVWVKASPVLDQLTLDLATALIKQYKLGRGTATDLLAVSLSATDYVGHRYGNQGPEMCDQMAHLDRALGAFLRTLDGLKVPYVVALSADHGAIDAAERTAQRGFPAERITFNIIKAVSSEVRGELGLKSDPFKYEFNGMYLTDRDLSAEQRERIIAVALASVDRQHGVERAFTKTEILKTQVKPGTPPDELTLLERYAESIDADRSPDVLVAFKPYVTFGRVDPVNKYIEGHGSPWNYDRRVPILFWWPGAQGYEQYLPVETVDIAPTLAALAGAKTPEVDGRCIDLDRGAGSTCGN